ncbi:MAG: type II toxin-antitoxin system VapC family toxin [Dehalococcoidia bacterium]
MLYVDTSALAKLLLPEHESAAIRDALRRQPLTSSVLLRVELMRAIRRRRPVFAPSALRLLSRVVEIDLDRSILEAAATLQPASVRTLDVIHLATAATLGSDLDALVTYDARMVAAAREAGLPVVSPE